MWSIPSSSERGLVALVADRRDWRRWAAAVRGCRWRGTVAPAVFSSQLSSSSSVLHLVQTVVVIWSLWHGGDDGSGGGEVSDSGEEAFSASPSCRIRRTNGGKHGGCMGRNRVSIRFRASISCYLPNYHYQLFRFYLPPHSLPVKPRRHATTEQVFDRNPGGVVFMNERRVSTSLSTRGRCAAGSSWSEMSSTPESTPPSPGCPNVFSIRIVSLDYYMAVPIPGLDFCDSPCFQGRCTCQLNLLLVTPWGYCCEFVPSDFSFVSSVAVDDDLSLSSGR